MSNRGRFRREPYQLKNGISKNGEYGFGAVASKDFRCGRGQALDALSGRNVN